MVTYMAHVHGLVRMVSIVLGPVSPMEDVNVSVMISKPNHVAWKWRKWTFGFWTDPDNWTKFGIDFGPLEVVWHSEGYRP